MGLHRLRTRFKRYLQLKPPPHLATLPPSTPSPSARHPAQVANLGCSRAITVGSTIMGSPVVASTDHSVQLKGKACGSNVKEGECLELDFTGSGEYVVEIAGSDFHGGVCSEKRQKKSDAAKVSVKKDGQGSAMTVRAAWAGGYGQVKVTSDCVYNIIAGEGEKLGCTGATAASDDDHDDHDHDHDDHDHDSSSSAARNDGATIMVLVSSLAIAFRAAVLP
eukprot:Tamp_19971.p1 GENE.Tamp_19971~~Tamp_19971.p1  ORF type:complete len:221 (+),score=39.04 Tamp_19971:102-764(+)